MTPFDNLRDYRAPDAFRVMDEATAGAIIGCVAGALILWDIVARIVEAVK